MERMQMLKRSYYAAYIERYYHISDDESVLLLNIFNHILVQAYDLPYDSRYPGICKTIQTIYRFKSEVENSLTIQRYIDERTFDQGSVDLQVAEFGEQLFDPGVDWRKIVVFIAFAVEIAIVSIKRDYSRESVMSIYHRLNLYVKNNLREWIKDNGGWEKINIYEWDPLYDEVFSPDRDGKVHWPATNWPATDWSATKHLWISSLIMVIGIKLCNFVCCK